MAVRDTSTLPKGFRLDEYEIESVLGQGRFGVTYLAREVRLGRHAAIKEYMPADLALRDDDGAIRPASSAVEEAFQEGLQAFTQELAKTQCTQSLVTARTSVSRFTST